MPDKGGEAKPRGVIPWGDELEPHRMNIWQGNFPHVNTAVDGYLSPCSKVMVLSFDTSLRWAFTAPAEAFVPQNELGLLNMMGNVWEWVSDWWSIDHAHLRLAPQTSVAVADTSGRVVSRSAPLDPTGPAHGTEKTKKGGSYLCHKSFCYRCACRTSHSTDM